MVPSRCCGCVWKYLLLVDMCLVACGMGSCVSGGCPGVGSDIPVVFHRVVSRVRTGLLILTCLVSDWWVVRVVSGVENLAQQTDRGPGAYGCGRPDVVCPTQISLGAAGSRGPRGTLPTRSALPLWSPGERASRE